MINKLECTKYGIECYIEPIPDCLGLIPYYCNSPEKITSHIYIIKTIKRMNLYTTNIVVYTNNTYDQIYLESIKTRFNLEFDILYIETIHPLLLPVNGLDYINKNINNYKQYKYILYNEADQIIYLNTNNILDILVYNNVLNLHRLDKLLFKTDHEIYESNGNAMIIFNGREYLLSNYRDFSSFDDKFFLNKTVIGCYGAAYLCTLETFSKTSFIEEVYLPMEHATLHHLEQGRNMLKTKNIFDAFSIHLSGINKIYNHLGFNIENYPEEW